MDNKQYLESKLFFINKRIDAIIGTYTHKEKKIMLKSLKSHCRPKDRYSDIKDYDSLIKETGIHVHLINEEEVVWSYEEKLYDIDAWYINRLINLVNEEYKVMYEYRLPKLTNLQLDIIDKLTEVPKDFLLDTELTTSKRELKYFEDLNEMKRISQGFHLIGINGKVNDNKDYGSFWFDSEELGKVYERFLFLDQLGKDMSEEEIEEIYKINYGI